MPNNEKPTGTKAFLPEVVCVNNSMQYSPEPGKWVGFRDSQLENLGRDIMIHDTDKTPDMISSIPTVWARPYLFYKALYFAIEKDNKGFKHPAHEFVTDEWRGLLALLCFSDILDIKIEIIKVKLANDGFTGIVKKLKPNDQYWPEEEFYLIKHIAGGKKRVLGGFSPLTLVFTGADYAAPAPSDTFTWVIKNEETQKFKFTDPLKCPKFAVDETMLSILNNWINETITRIKQFQPADNKEYKRHEICSLLEKWKAEIEKKIIAHASPAVFSIYNNISENSFYSTFARKAKLPIDIKQVFVEKLIKLQNINTQYIKPLKWKSGRTEPVFTFPVRLRFLKEKGYEIDYDKCFIEELEDPGSSGNRFKVRIQLNKSGAGYSLHKDFYAKDIIEYDNIPLLDIWPRYNDPAWNRYYCLFSHSEDIQTNVRLQVFSMKDEPDVVASRVEDKLSVYCLKSFPSIIELQSVPVRDLPDGKKEALQGEGEPLGIFAIEAPNAERTENTSVEVSIDFGTSNTNVFLLDGQLVKKRMEINDLKPLEVFNNNTPYANVLRSTNFISDSFIFPITTALLYKKEAANQRISFIHGMIPFQNIEKMEDDVAKMFSSQIRTQIKWTTDPKMMPLVDMFITQLMLLIAYHVKYNLKKSQVHILWSYPLSFEKNRITIFKSTWEKSAKSVYETTGVDIKTSYFRNIDDKQIDIDEGIATALYCTEKREDDIVGTGNGKYFVSVDIGGGTTDLVIWDSKKGSNYIKENLSFRMGGVLLFEDLFSKSDVFMKKIVSIANFGSNEAERKVKTARIQNMFANSSIYNGSIINNIMSQKGENVVSYFTGNLEDEPVKYGRSVIFWGFASMFYFLGQLFYKQDPAISNVTVHIGGNASKLLKLLYPDISKVYEKLGRGAFAIGYREELRSDQITICLSDEPKEEVCRGLLIHEDNKFLKSISSTKDQKNEIGNEIREGFSVSKITKKDSKAVIVGETGILLDKDELARNDYILLDKAHMINPTLSKFELLNELCELGMAKHEFLNFCDDLLIYPLKFDRNVVFSAIQGAFRGKESDIVLESPFIIGARALIKKMQEDRKTFS